MAGPKYASGKYSIAQCDRCNFRFKLKDLRIQTLKTKPYKIKVCRTCYDPDHPQLQLGMYPVFDSQAVREPRPDVSYLVSGTSGLQINLTGVGPDGIGSVEMGSRQIFWGWNPVGGGSNWPQTPNPLVAVAEVGSVVVDIT